MDAVVHYLMQGWISLRCLNGDMQNLGNGLTALYDMRSEAEFIADVMCLLELCIDTGGRTGQRRQGQYLRVIRVIKELLAEDYEVVRQGWEDFVAAAERDHTNGILMISVRCPVSEKSRWQLATLLLSLTPSMSRRCSWEELPSNRSST